MGCVTDTQEESKPAEEMIMDTGLWKPLKRSFLNTEKENKGNKVFVVQIDNTHTDDDSEQSGESQAEIVPPAHDENRDFCKQRSNLRKKINH